MESKIPGYWKEQGEGAWGFEELDVVSEEEYDWSRNTGDHNQVSERKSSLGKLNPQEPRNALK